MMIFAPLLTPYRLNILVGMVIIGALAALLIISKPKNGCDSNLNSHYYGLFNNIDGLKLQSPILLAGVEVGRICGFSYDNNNHKAKIDFVLNNAVPVPEDSAFLILSDGFGGAKYMKIAVGGALDNLPVNQRVEYTQDSILFDELLAKIVNNAEQNQKSRKGINQ